MITYLPDMVFLNYDGFFPALFQTTSKPSAPSCELLDLSPSPPSHGATVGELNAMNAQLSDLGK